MCIRDRLSDGMHMAVACAAAAIDAGAVMVKTATSPMGVPLTQDFASYMEIKGDAKGLRCGLRTTELGLSLIHISSLPPPASCT